MMTNSILEETELSLGPFVLLLHEGHVSLRNASCSLSYSQQCELCGS